jgi:hypothetical protein
MAFRTRMAASGAALLVALGAALPAAAAVTAQQVWDDWKAQMASSGSMTMTTGSESYAGGVLTVTDLALHSEDETGTVMDATLPSLTFTENADGTVAVATAETVPITVSSPADEAAGTTSSMIALEVRQAGATVTVSGEPGALAYDFAASRTGVAVTSVMEDGAAVPVEAQVTLNGLSGTATSTTGEMREMGYQAQAASVDVLVDATSPEDGTHVTFSGQVADLGLTADLAMPTVMPTSPEELLMAGLDGSGGYTFGAGNYLFEVTSPTAGATNGTLTSGGGEVSFNLSRAAMGYDATVSGVALEATSASMPFPISVSLAEYGINVLIPAQKSDTPQDWALGVNLTDLAVNEEIWSMIDPGAMFAHDPATLIVDLSGTATLLFDLFDPAQQAAMEAAPVPGELNSIALNDLNVSIGGAQVTGTGAFTLDNTDTTTFPGMPKPTGSADLQLTGINTLIDNLVAMGLLPQEQVMGARMMLGLLTVPVAGQEDAATSHIEVTADGQLLANGQRLQ